MERVCDRAHAVACDEGLPCPPVRSRPIYLADAGIGAAVSRKSDVAALAKYMGWHRCNLSGDWYSGKTVKVSKVAAGFGWDPFESLDAAMSVALMIGLPKLEAVWSDHSGVDWFASLPNVGGEGLVTCLARTPEAALAGVALKAVKAMRST